MISEPATLFTDYVLAAANTFFGARLLRLSSRAARFWAAGFLALAVSAAIGGTFHGFRALLTPGTLVLMWQVTEIAIGVASLCLLMALAHAYLGGTAKQGLAGFAIVKFALYCLAVALTDRYLVAVADTGVTMLIALVLALQAWVVGHEPSARWLVAGVLVSVAAAGVQAAGLAPHRHFNHNDLYHVIQLLGMYLLYRGGRLFENRVGPASSL